MDATQHPNDAHLAPQGRRPRVVAEASAEMQAQIDRLETIYERAPIGIGLVDFEGRTTMTNEVLRELLGFTPEEFASIPFSEFTHPDDVARNLELFERMAAGEIEHFDMVKRFIRKDGRTLWADLTVSLVRDAEGRPEYAIGMTQDITERKRLESELRAAEERYRLLVERVPAVVYVAEPGTLGRWSYVSPQIEHMLGFTAQEWVADGCLNIYSNDPDKCVYGDAGAPKLAVVLGDSTAISYLPGLRPVLEEQGYRIHMLTMFSCPAWDISVGSAGSEPGNRGAGPAWRTPPGLRREPRARMCGWSAASSRPSTGVTQQSVLSNSAAHASRVRVAKTAAMRRRRSGQRDSSSWWRGSSSRPRRRRSSA